MLRRTLAVVACALCLTAAAQPASANPIGTDNLPVQFVKSILNPDASPPGANDWSCKPSRSHPRPVVLVHGTLENARDNWHHLSPILKAAGYCVFALNYGESTILRVLKGTADIPASAHELAAFVDQVRKATKAAKVDLVGHSQGGGVLPIYYLKRLGGAAKVHTLVGISPSNHGTTVDGLHNLLEAAQILYLVGVVTGPALAEQVAGSALMRSLYAGGDTSPGVHYVTIVSKLDEVLTPYSRQFLTAGRGASVRNIVLQDNCPLDLVDHLGTPYDPIATRYVLNALDPAHAQKPACEIELPVIT